MMRKVYQHIQCMLCHYRGQKSLSSVGSTVCQQWPWKKTPLYNFCFESTFLMNLQFYLRIKFGNFQVYFQCRHASLHEIMNFDCTLILCWSVYSRALYLFVNLSLTSYVTIIEFMKSFWHLNENMSEIWKSSLHNFVNQNS